MGPEGGEQWTSNEPAQNEDTPWPPQPPLRLHALQSTLKSVSLEVLKTAQELSCATVTTCARRKAHYFGVVGSHADGNHRPCSERGLRTADYPARPVVCSEGHGKVTKNERGMLPIILVVVNAAPGQMTANDAWAKTVSCDKSVVQDERFCPNPLATLQYIQLFTIVSTMISDPNPT